MSKAIPSETKPFSKLPVSTQTVMVYINCKFNIKNIAEKLYVEPDQGLPLDKIKGEHGLIYQLKHAGTVRGVPSKKGNFRNQATLYIWIVNKMITVKIFPTGKLHMTGCKNVTHQQETVAELLTQIRAANEEAPTYTMDIPEGAEGTEGTEDEDDEESDEPMRATLEVVMTNIDFQLGFEVDQIKLDELCQADNTDFYTIFETPVNTSVNIKLDYADPEKKKFNQVVVGGPIDDPQVEFVTTTECPKARKNLTRTHTFLVFSNKVIQSGRYYDSEMEPAFKKFNKFIQDNRPRIELQLQDNKFDISKLKGLQTKALHLKTPSKRIILS